VKKKKLKTRNKGTEPERPDLSVRDCTIDVRAKDGDTPASVRMSVSSEEPVLTVVRFNGDYMQAYEILDHTTESVDLSRARDGLVVLDRHYGDQIGLMSVEVRDEKLGGAVRFGAGQRAQEIAQDAETGIRRNVSVGYLVDAASYRLEGDKDGIPVVRAMHWTPYEASFEPVPADPTVGVSRAGQNVDVPAKRAHKENKDMKPKEMAKLFARAAKFGIDQSKVEALFVEDATYEGVRAQLDALIVDKQSDDNEGLRGQITVLNERKPDITPDVAPVVVPPIGGDAETQTKVVRRYSVMNVLRRAAGIDRDALGNKVDVGFEQEINDECRDLNMGSARGGQFIVPHAVLASRDFTVSGSSSASVSTDLYASEFIDLLRTKYALGRLGVRFMSGLVGNVAIPKMTAGATGYWVAEGTDVTESQPTLGQITGTPHTCGVLTDISRRMLLQSTPDAEAMVRDEIVQRINRTVQVAVFQGSGAGGEPAAITNASGINNPSIAVAGTPTFAEIVSFPGAVMADNADADGQKWSMTAEVWEKLATTKKDAGSGDFVLNTETKQMLGRGYEVTEDVGANSLFFGDWSSVVVGLWGAGIDLNLDTATLSAQGGLRIVGLQDVDVMVRLGEALAYNAAVTA